MISFLYKPNGLEPDTGELTVVSMVNGILRYKVDQPEINRFKIVYEETYEEASVKVSKAVCF